jgi:hypothetical protein
LGYAGRFAVSFRFHISGKPSIRDAT